MHKRSPVSSVSTLAGASCMPTIKRLALAVALTCCVQPALAELPTGYTVVQGPAVVSNPTASTMRVDVGASKAVINWNSFSISNGSGVTFVQPGATSIVLNRVTGASASDISGSLSANGQLFLVNPNGVFFGATARVDVAGLVASTLDIADGDFTANTYAFAKKTGSTLGQVVNNGVINAGTGGYVALVGEQVLNGATGVISAPEGKIALGVGERVSMTFDNNQLLTFTIDQKALDSAALVRNNGQLLADGGSVQMKAAVASALAGAAVNQSGVIRAQGVSQKNGEVYLSSDGGDIEVSGSIDVGGLTGAPASSLRLSAASGGITLTDSAAVSVGGAAGTSINLTSSGRVSLGGTISAQSAEGAATIGVQGNTVALNSALLNANGFMTSFVSVNSGTGAITQNAAGQINAVSTATAQQAANAGGNAFAGMILGGDGSHVLAGSLQAGARGPNAATQVDITSNTGAVTVNQVSSQASGGGISSSLSLSAAGNIASNGNLSSTADAGPASASIAAGGGVQLGGNLSVQSLSGTDSATLATISAASGNIVMANGSRISIGDTTTAGIASNGAGLSINAAQGRLVLGDISVTSAAGATQGLLNGAGGVALGGDVTASGQSARLNISASGADISLAAGKTVLATSTVAGGGGALVNVSTPGGSLHIDGGLRTQVPGGDPAQVLTNPALPSIPPQVPNPQLLFDPGQSLLTRLLSIARTTPSNPLASNELIVLPAWDIVGMSMRSGGSLDAALFEEDNPDGINPTSDKRIGAEPINAAMRK